MPLGSNEHKIFYNSNFRDNNKDIPAKYRTVLHCDGNAFFASCEATLHPEYNEVPFAVCGSSEERHGIVLAKNELAKKYGIKTSETVWKAKQKCPALLTVRPTYGLYTEISRKMNRIFYDYTDLVEPFGIDESWLDVTGSLKLFGDGVKIADEIRARTKKELGITVSVGVSFNKVFAKLGSDLKKPNATSVIPYNGFEAAVWGLPVGALLFVGRSCEEKLRRVGIYTIGDLATADIGFLSRYLGKMGVMLRDFALGRDFAEVTPMGYESDPKSISNGMTFKHNLITDADISFAVNYLSDSIAQKLRSHGMLCNTVAVSIRRADLTVINRRAPLSAPTCVRADIARTAVGLVKENSAPGEEIYSLTVHSENLKHTGECFLQQSLFPTAQSKVYEKHLALESTVDRIRERFGKNAVRIASSLNNSLL